MPKWKISPKTAGICGILGPTIAAIFIATSISINLSWWTWAGSTLSDLGHVVNPVVNYEIIFSFGLFIAGIIGFTFALGLPRLVNGKIGLIGIGILAVGTINLSLIGLFPAGMELHNPFSYSFFSIMPISMIVLAIDQLLDKSDRPWGILLIGILAIGLSAFLLNLRIPTLYHGSAINETIGALAFAELSIIFGGRLLSEARV